MSNQTLAKRRSYANRISLYMAKQAELLHPRLSLAQALLRCIPFGTFGNVRSAVYRWAGFTKINRKVYIAGILDLRGDGDVYSRLSIGEHTFINVPCFIEANAPVHIGKAVGIGHHTVFITSNHEIGTSEARMGKLQPAPVTIGDGAWIGAHVTVLPGVTIGPGAVVAAGSLVTRDVLPNAKVAGIPARVIGWLEPQQSYKENPNV